MTHIIDIDEVAEWLSRRGLLGARSNQFVYDVDLSSLPQIRGFSIPTATVAAPVFAAALADFFVTDPETLVYIDHWGAWDHLQDLNLFNRFRQGLGETSLIWEKPGHLFTTDGHKDLVSLVLLVLSFSWGCCLVSSTGTVAMRISHDDLAFIHALDEAEVSVEALRHLDGLIEPAHCD